MKKLVIAAAVVGITSCSTVTIRPDGKNQVLSNNPNYEESQSYFLWGLAGENFVDVVEICEGKEVIQMQSQFTFVDQLLGGITLGLYSPKTAKVWCGEKSVAEKTENTGSKWEGGSNGSF